MKFITITSAILFSMGVAAAQPVLLHTHEDMVEFHPELNSHVGEEHLSSIEDIFSYRSSIESSVLLNPKHVPSEQRAPHYPRIKHMRDGRWIMIYQGGYNSSRIYAIFSNDLKTWYGKQQLWGPEQVNIGGRTQYKRYSCADILQLKTGELVCLAAFRCDFASAEGKGSGIVMKRSRDCGEHWAKSEVIYNQPCAQPGAIELPDGRLQCYFSDWRPKADSYSIAMIESFDGGYTWGAKTIIARQFKFYKDGYRSYTDMLPCFRLLNDGKTVFGTVEDRLQPDGPETRSVYNVSIMKNDSPHWPAVTGEEDGPAEGRQSNIILGRGAYFDTFRSGETLFSAVREGYLGIKLGDAAAEKFQGKGWESGWFTPFEETGTWGCAEVTDKNRFVYSQDSKNAMHYGVAWLNHRITAFKKAITPDGDTREWFLRDALFIGSDSDVQTVFRAAHDDTNLYIAIDRKDASVNASSKVSLTVHNEAAKKFSNGNTVSLIIGPDGLISSNDWSKSAAQGVKAVTRRAKTRNGEKGYVCEICIPLSSLGASSGSNLRFNAVVEGDSLADGFTNVQDKKPQTWQRIRLQ